MSLLSIVLRVCDEVGLPRPTAVATSTDQLARQLFALANTELEELSKRFDWPVLTREKTFNTVAGTTQYALPADYRKFISNSIYDRSAYTALRGSLSPSQWQAAQISSPARTSVRIYGNPLKLNITPAPASVETLVFEYMTTNFAVSSMGAEKPLYGSDDDSSLIDEALVRMGLKWRAKHAKGLEFSADLAEYEAVVAREFAAAMAQPFIPVGFSRHSEEPITTGTIRSQGFGV
jgi:hypothetical protein